MKQHLIAYKDLNNKELFIVLYWFIFKRKKWKYYNMLVRSYYYGNVAYKLANV